MSLEVSKVDVEGGTMSVSVHYRTVPREAREEEQALCLWSSM